MNQFNHSTETAPGKHPLDS